MLRKQENFIGLGLSQTAFLTFFLTLFLHYRN